MSYIHSTLSNPIKSNGWIDRYIQRWGRFRGVFSSEALCINIFRGPLLVFPTVAPEVVPTINLPWGFYREELVGKSGSGPPLLNAHYNLLLSTVPHDNPPARPLRFSIGYHTQCQSASNHHCWADSALQGQHSNHYSTEHCLPHSVSVSL